MPLFASNARPDAAKRRHAVTQQKKTAPRTFASTSIDTISAFSHRSARLVLSLCKSEARYVRFRDLVEQELGAYAVKHLDELRRMVNS
jgi:hypothetical protein